MAIHGSFDHPAMPERRWIVTSTDGPTVADVLKKCVPDDPNALNDGRVFLGAKRVVDGSVTVKPGDHVVVYEQRNIVENAENAVRILAERDGVIAAYKPAPIASVPEHRGARGTLVDEVAKLCKLSVNALHVTSRLDVGVSGVVLFATTEKARQSLVVAREKGLYRREYLGIAKGKFSHEPATWAEPIGSTNDSRKRAVNGRDASSAKTHASLIVSTDEHSLLHLRPVTGRTHQLRVHCAHHGHPLVGDSYYGGEQKLVKKTGAIVRFQRIALHAWRVSVPFAESSQTERWVVVADVPQSFRSIWQQVDGRDEVWDTLPTLDE